jgi:Tol biopolymer transport system component
VATAVRTTLIAICLAALALAPSANATFPGGNGKIVYVAGGNLATINPDGTGQVQLTNTGDAGHPSWSLDGSKIAFDRTIGGNSDIWVMNADGTGMTQLTNDPAADSDPTWSPDATRIAFVSTRDGDSEIYSMNADGSGQVNLTNNTTTDAAPDWAPDGSLIAFYHSTGGFTHNGIWTMNPDGTDQREVSITYPPSSQFNSNTPGNEPSWHPEGWRLAYSVYSSCGSSSSLKATQDVLAVDRDGSNPRVLTGSCNVAYYAAPAWSPTAGQIAFTRRSCVECTDWRIAVANADGTNRVEIADGNSPNWQATPQPRYVRPRGATPFTTSFVPAYHACTSPNRTHGAPLAHPSCTPPNPTSFNVTAGTPEANGAAANFLGSATLKVVPDNSTTAADEADVKVSASVTDIRCTDTTIACTGGDLSDYTGSMRLALTVGLTDTYVPNLPATSAGEISIPVPCAATADPAIGSACSTATTVDSVLPGAVREGNRAIWGLRALELWDGGQDGLLATRDDDTVFAVQGVFVP